VGLGPFGELFGDGSDFEDLLGAARSAAWSILCRTHPHASSISWHMTSNNPQKFKVSLFKNGRSQAVRLPKTLRFDSEEVYVWKEGERLILEAVPRDAWPDGYWQKLDDLGRNLEFEIEPLEPNFLDLELE
jgi:antitoxin VapB